MTTAERREALRERLVEAAEAVIAADGYGALRARDLAKTVGCAVGAIYTVFPDLDALVLVTSGRTLAALDATMERTVDRDAPPRARLIALALAYLGFAAENTRRWRALFEHRVPDGYAMPDWYGHQLDTVLRHLREPVALLLPDTEEGLREDIAQTLFAATHGVVLLGLDGKAGRIAPDLIAERVRLFVGAAVDGLAADPPGRPPASQPLASVDQAPSPR